MIDSKLFPGIRLDWNAYWRGFKELHGDPVPWRGRLLCPDGWTHAAADPAGPEWPPPDDPAELREMQHAYWRIRRNVVRAELLPLREAVAGLRALRDTLSAPLMMIAPVEDEAGRMTERSVPADPDEIERGRLAWLEADLARCDEMLASLANSAGPDEQYDHVWTPEAQPRGMQEVTDAAQA